MKNYSFDPELSTLIIGTHAVTGFAEGTQINIETPDETYVDDVDAHGNNTRRKNSNRNGLITIFLTEASDSNDALSVFYNLDENLGTGTFPLLYRDNNGTSVITSQASYVKKISNMTVGREANVREWVIRITGPSYFIGGYNL